MTHSVASALGEEVSTPSHPCKPGLDWQCRLHAHRSNSVSTSETQEQPTSLLSLRGSLSRCLTPWEQSSHPHDEPALFFTVAGFPPGFMKKHPRRRSRSNLHLGEHKSLRRCAWQCSRGKEAIKFSLAYSQTCRLIFSDALEHRTCVNNGGFVDSHDSASQKVTSVRAWARSKSSTPTVCTTAGRDHQAQPVLLCNQKDPPTRGGASLPWPSLAGGFGHRQSFYHRHWRAGALDISIFQQKPCFS